MLFTRLAALVPAAAAGCPVRQQTLQILRNGMIVIGLSLALLPLARAEGPKVNLETSLGEIVLELDEERAPQTVRNFLEYVDSGFYDETLFHRVIEGFMIQGGGFDRQYQRKSTRAPISNEAWNGLRNRQYTVAMARTTAPHSATSQFFINSVDNRNLDHTDTSQRGWGYAVFGRVVQGQEIVDAISRVRTGPGGPFSRDVPTEQVVILKAHRSSDIETAGSRNSSAQPESAAATTSAGTALSSEQNAVTGKLGSEQGSDTSGQALEQN